MKQQRVDTQKIRAMYFVKNGMAKKAFLKNLQTGNVKAIQKQIENGTVKPVQ